MVVVRVVVVEDPVVVEVGVELVAVEGADIENLHTLGSLSWLDIA
jgi:hypothetical protein